MQRSPIRFRSAAALAAAAVLAACGGSEEPAAEEPSFCAQADGALADVEPAFDDEADPAELAPVLQQAADEVRAIEPPREIRSDWSALADGIEQFAQEFAAVDVDDPASAAAFQQRTNEIVTELSTSADAVQEYLSRECGADATEAPAPTS
jgi:ABC-type glycerol-3-phosphate transport system substrate-binding protein